MVAILHKYVFDLTKSFSPVPAQSKYPPTEAKTRQLDKLICSGFELLAKPDRHNRFIQRRNHMSHPLALITGALTGIGRATALAFAKEVADLVVSGRRDDAGQALVAELRALGTAAEFILADLRH